MTVVQQGGGKSDNDIPTAALAAFGFALLWFGIIHKPSAPDPGPAYETNAVPMTYTDQCGEAPSCVWWWQYDKTGMPGWVLHYGPHADMPADARPARSLPVLAEGS